MKLFKFLAFITVLFANVSFGLTEKALMKSYCAVPPYMDVEATPNIILVIDYSGSMQLPAHFGCGFDHITGTTVVTCENNPEEETYDQTKTYYGYFEPAKYYKYNFSGEYWEETVCSVPSGKEKIGSGPDCISGNLLNWVSMSRYDTALKALTGGKLRGCKNSGDSNKCLIIKGAKRIVKENNIDCQFTIEPNRNWKTQTEFNDPEYDLLISVEDNGGSCPIGEFSNRFLRVKVDPANRKGVLQKNASLGNFAFFAFSASGYTEFDRKGEIKFGIHEYRSYNSPEEAMNALIEKIESEEPWGGTPTGEALYEVYDYLKQSNSRSYEQNSSYINKGTYIDPFYDKEQGQLSPCIKNYILLISDGDWNGVVDPDYPAYYIHTRDIRSDLYGTQIANTFTIFTFSSSESAINSMKTIAAVGSFIDLDDDNDAYDIPVWRNSLYISWPRDRCNPNGTYNENCKEWDFDKDGVPNTFFYASDGQTLEQSLSEALNTILKYQYSGGSLGVMAEKNKDESSLALAYKGSVLAQTMFFSQKDGVDWIGKIYGYWYYFEDSTIREDSNQNKVLEIDTDKIIEFILEGERQLRINRYNVGSSGEKLSLDDFFYDTDDINYLFEVGQLASSSINESDSLITNDRKVFFAKCENPTGSDFSCSLEEFRYSSLDKFVSNFDGWEVPLLGFPQECFDMCPYWNNESTAVDLWNAIVNKCITQNNDYEKIVNYIRGRDYTGFRTRTINGNVWKLGDIMYSVPQIIRYESKNKSYMFVGANDGMLHAYEIGTLTKVEDSNGAIVKLEGNNVGKEIWTFIPFNTLPYLRFLANPEYCHMYFVDLTPKVYETNDGRVILIGGLRFGAAVGSTNLVQNTSNQGDNPVNPVGWSCPFSFKDEFKDMCQNCVNTQGKNLNCDSIDSINTFGNCVGLSSYFALDITDPENPELLWEFTHPDLGFSYGGATLVQKKDKYYVLIGSGPTSYDGNSTQNLKFFVIPLDNPDLSNPVILDTGIRYAFGGRLPKYGLDVNEDGSTDYVFVGYARQDGSMDNWKGGLLQIDVRDYNPSNWRFTTYFRDAIPPIVARVEVAKCFDIYYLFFGTGRWFYKLDNPLSGQSERLYGTPLNCDLNTGSCSVNTNVANSTNSGRNVCTDARNGVLRAWYIDLNKNDDGYLKERVITDPVVANGKIAIFTTIEPKDDACSFGGRTRVWALNCATGGGIEEECGTYPIDEEEKEVSILLPLSGGDIQQVSVDQLVQKYSDWLTGTSPEGSPPVITGVISTTRVGEVLLWIER